MTRTQPSWKRDPRILLAAVPLWFVACSSTDGGVSEPPSRGGSSGTPSATGGSSGSTSGGAAQSGAAGAPLTAGSGQVTSGGASGFGTGSSGVSNGGSVSGPGGAASGTGGAISSSGGSMVDPCAGVTCGAGQTCSNGSCMCTTGMLCSDGCFDTQNDLNHCGGCTTQCAPDGACVSGQCINPVCNPDTQSRSGHITHYTLATSMVACHYPTNTLPQYYGAMNEYDWNSSGVCGGCVEITNTQNNKKLTVTIADECPYKGNEMWCFQGSHHIDLNNAAYSALGANNNPAISWKYVACANTGKINYYFDSASQQYYLAVTPMNAKNLVSKMEVKVMNVFTALSHTSYNTYELKTGAGTGALTFRLTDIYNHVITDSVTLSAGKVVQGGAQFAACP